MQRYVICIVYLFIILNSLFYLDKLPLKFEEPRRAIIAHEMLYTKNFIMPKICQIPYYKKPPFHNWLIALTGIKDKYISNFEIRLPSIIFWILTSLGIIFLTKDFLAGLIFLTSFSTMISYAPRAEPDMVFASLIFFSYLFFLKDRLFFSGLCMGASILTKGLSPIFFYPPLIVCSFFYRENFKKLFFQFLYSTILPLGWIILYSSCGNIHQLFNVLLSQFGNRAHSDIHNWIKSAIVFPLRVCSATFPWCLGIFAIDFNKIKILKRDKILFSSALIFMFIFFILLISSHGKGRYFLPAVPFFAIFWKDIVNFKIPIKSKILELFSILFGLVFIFIGIFLILTHYTFQGVFILISGIILGILMRFKVKILEEFLIILTLGISILYVHLFRFYKTTYLYNYKKSAKEIVFKLKEYKFPVVVDWNLNNLKFLFNLEREGRIVLYRPDKNFKKFIFITTHKLKNGKFLFTYVVKNQLLYLYLIT